MATSVEEVRKGGGAYATKLLKQARRYEEVVRRLELLNMHAGDDKAEKYITLNRRTLGKIEQTAETKMEWGKDIRVRLGGGIRMQAGSVMIIP